MADIELPYEYQLDEIAIRVNRFRADGIQLELYLTPTFLKYFPVTMEPGVLADIKWNDISGLFVRSPVTYMDNDLLLAMSCQHVWDADLPTSYHPRCSLTVVKLFPSVPVYPLATIYVPTTQARLHFLSALTSLHNLQMEAAALVYMPKSCIYMSEPSSGDHYTLLPLARDKTICLGALLMFVAAKLTVASKYSTRNIGVHLKFPPSFDPQLDSVDLINELALRCGPIWKNVNYIVCGEDR